MSRSLLFWILLGLWFILGWWLCRKFICGASTNVTSNAAAVAPIIAAADNCNTSMILKDGSGLDLTASRNVRFLESNFTNITNNTETDRALQQTADYLKNNANRSLTITGKYNEAESYDGILPNLGMARATTIKNILTGMGAPSNQLDVRGITDGSGTNNEICYREGVDLGSGDGTGTGSGSGGGGAAATAAMGAFASNTIDTITNGIGFSFGAAGTGDARLADIKARLFGKPLTVYFETNATRLSLSDQQKKDVADLSYYLDNVPGASLSVDGHTDSRGSSTTNRRLSRGRAEFVKSYITRNGGISGDRMSSQGFGPAKPIGSNDTKEGRAKNRRVEVILK